MTNLLFLYPTEHGVSSGSRSKSEIDLSNSDLYEQQRYQFEVIAIRTRLHSSRMRTARALTVSHSMLAGGGGGVTGVCSGGAVCLGGCLLLGMCVLRGVSALGGSALGGVCSWGEGGLLWMGVLPGGSAPRGV